MLTTVYIVNSEPVDLNKVVLPNYVEGREAGLGYGYKAVALATHGSLIQHGIDALVSVYPSARVTSLRSQAATWCHELGTWGGARPGAGRPRLTDEPTVEATISLPTSLDTKAQQIGAGNRSAGIRLALEAFGQ